jgi:hypothetical protein
MEDNKATIHAINTMKYPLMIGGYLMLLAFGILLTVFSRAETGALVLLGLILFAGVILLCVFGAFLTSRVKLSQDGFVHSCWFGLRRYEARWEDCAGYGLFYVNKQVFAHAFQYFSKDWIMNGVNADGSNDWAYLRQRPNRARRPRFFQDLCLVEYSDGMYYDVLRDFLPDQIQCDLDEQTQKIAPLYRFYTPLESFKRFFRRRK